MIEYNQLPRDTIMSWVLGLSWSCTSFEMDDSKILESFDSNIREEFWNLILIKQSEDMLVT